MFVRPCRTVSTVVLTALVVAACEGSTGPGARVPALVYHRVSVNGGPAAIIAAAADGSGEVNLTPGDWDNPNPVWSPDGRRIAFFRAPPGPFPRVYSLAVMDADGSNVRLLTPPLDLEGARGNYNPYISGGALHWSPDGRRLLFAHYDSLGLGLYTVGVDDGSAPVAVPLARPSYDTPVGWSPDGGRIAFLSQPPPSTQYDDPTTRLYVAALDGSGRVPVLQASADSTAEDVTSAAWSPDGTRFVIHRLPGLLEVVNSDGSSRRSLPTGDGMWNEPQPQATASAFGAPAWSPDGRRIVYTMTHFPPIDTSPIPGDGAPTQRIAVISASGGTFTQLTRDEHPSRSMHPSWRRIP